MESSYQATEHTWEGGLFGESQETCHIKRNEAKVPGVGLSR
jgi:hypothetical protein